MRFSSVLIPRFYWFGWVESFAIQNPLLFFIFASNNINPFVPNAPFLYLLKTSENLSVFWYFQGVEKGCIGNEWVNSVLLTFSEILFALSQFVKFFKSKLIALFNFLTESLICRRFVSLAKWRTWQCLMAVFKSLMLIRNNSGPRTESAKCGDKEIIQSSWGMPFEALTTISPYPTNPHRGVRVIKV